LPLRSPSAWQTLRFAAMTSSRSLAPRLAALVAVMALALGATACGSSDDDGGGSEGSSEVAQARATVDRLYSSMRASDAEGVCSTLTEPAQKQVAEGAIGAGEGSTCADAFQQFLDAAEKQGGLDLTLKAKVKNIEINGDKAVASVSFGTARSGKIPLIKQDGEWKLDQAGATPPN